MRPPLNWCFWRTRENGITASERFCQIRTTRCIEFYTPEIRRLDQEQDHSRGVTECIFVVEGAELAISVKTDAPINSVTVATADQCFLEVRAARFILSLIHISEPTRQAE